MKNTLRTKISRKTNAALVIDRTNEVFKSPALVFQPSLRFLSLQMRYSMYVVAFIAACVKCEGVNQFNI